MKFTFTDKEDTRSGFGAGLHELGKSNPNVVCLCADLTGSLKMDAFKKEISRTLLSSGGMPEANMIGQFGRFGNWQQDSVRARSLTFQQAGFTIRYASQSLTPVKC